MRTFTHLIEAESCEAQGCRVKRRLCGIYRMEGGAVIACSRQHARAADRLLTETDRRKERRR